MSQDKFQVEVFSKEELEKRIKDIDAEIKRRQQKLADTIMYAITQKKTNDTRTNDTRWND
jgi:hypothetical protein